MFSCSLKILGPGIQDVAPLISSSEGEHTQDKDVPGECFVLPYFL